MKDILHVPRLCFYAFLVVPVSTGQDLVTFTTQDGARISGLIYGQGQKGVVLVHGGRLTKESWNVQARQLKDEGYRVLAIDLRGFGQSVGPGQEDPFSTPLQYDVLAAVRFIRSRGASAIAVVGASMGGAAAADAVTAASPGEISALVILGAGAGHGPPEKIRAPKLLIVAKDDADADGPRLAGIERQFARMPEPKRLLIVNGSAHAQFLFQTPEGEHVMREIINFLRR